MVECEPFKRRVPLKQKTIIIMKEQIIRQVINAWASQNKAVTALVNKYDDAVYLKEVAPGRNRAIYIFGHLIAASDNLLPLFGLGAKLFPQLSAFFSSNPARTFANIPPISHLLQPSQTL